MYMYVCVRMYTAYVHICLYVCVYLRRESWRSYECMCVCTYVCVCILTQKFPYMQYVNTYIHKYVHGHITMHTRIHMSAATRYSCHMYVYTRTCAYTYAYMVLGSIMKKRFVASNDKQTRTHKHQVHTQIVYTHIYVHIHTPTWSSGA